MLRITAVGALSLSLALLACHPSPDEPTDPLVPEVEQIDDPGPGAAEDIVEPVSLGVVTYDGSGELVHPDALVFPHDWRGRRYWYAATPYPFGDAAFENPSGYSGNDAGEWRPLPGIANPLARPDIDAYLSDPDLSFDPVRDELRLYYRQTTNDADEIYLKSSHDGAAWGPATLVVKEAKWGAISPAVVRERDGSWRMWAVNAANGGCRARMSAVALTRRRSRDGIKWGGPEPVSLTIPNRVPWHWDVQYIGAKHEYWALIAAFPDGSNCSRSSVFFARSTDGSSWTVSPTPLLGPGVIEPLRDLVYRSTFRYFARSDQVTVWFSGAREVAGKLHYALATARYPLAELMRRVSAPSSGAANLATSAIGNGHRVRLDSARTAFIEVFP
ncbi:MAG: hypothetical protein ABIT20_11250 [Gemmatimonadaceae bacterium]